MPIRINGHVVTSDPSAGRRLLHDGTTRDAATSIVRDLVKITGRPGTLPLGGVPVHDERPFNLKWRITGSTKDEVVNRLNALKAILGKPRLTIEKDFTATLTLSVEVELVTVTESDVDLSALGAEFTATFALVDPFWRAPATEVTITGAGVAVPSGTAPAYDAVFRLAGSTTAVTITDQESGTSISWSGAAGGAYLYIDPLSMRAWQAAGGSWMPSGTDVSAGLDYGVNGPLQATHGGSVTVSGGQSVTVRSRGCYQ